MIIAFILVNPIQIYYEFRIRQNYNWDDEEYQDWCCSEKSLECEKYFETVEGLPCYLVYGISEDHTVAHMWNIVMVNGIPYEFESTNLNFQKTSDGYIVQDIQEGFYKNGVKYEKSIPMDDWEHLI